MHTKVIKRRSLNCPLLLAQVRLFGILDNILVNDFLKLSLSFFMVMSLGFNPFR